MKISILNSWMRASRRTAVFAAMVSTTALLPGCVSAVDDPAFGFNNPTPPAAANGTAATSDTETSDATAVADASAAVSPDAATASPAAEKTGRVTADAAAAEGDKSESAPLASGRTAIAAYAGGTVSPSDATEPAAETPAKAKSSLFASLFAESEAKTPKPPAPAPDAGKSQRVILKPQRTADPVSGGGSEMAALPGVKSRASLFEIGHRASADYDAEILEEANGDEGTYEVASLSGMARMAPNGLMVQRPDVQTNCFEPKLVSMLRAVEARFNTKVVVTSGYRSPTYNKRVNGAQKSMHMSCKAADIQVPGADNTAVANFVRTLPGRGGVGTYCHTKAIHVDIGRERDWNWACRRRRA